MLVLPAASLVKEAAIESKQGGERGITPRSIQKVTAVRISIPLRAT